MAEGFEPFHVPQQSRRDKLRVVAQNHPTCEEATASATLHGCAGLLPLYDPSLLPSDMLTCANAGASEFHHHNDNPLGGGAGDGCKQNPACVVKEEGGNLIGYVGGFINACSSSSSSHHPYLDPQSSLALNPSSIQDINTNSFLYTSQNLRDFDHSFHGGDVVAFKPETLSMAPDSTTTGQGLSLSLSSHHTRPQNLPLELNLPRYEPAMLGDKSIGGFIVRGVGGASTSNDVLRSSAPLGPFTGYASILKGSRFLKPAQQLLEELCGVGRGIYAERSCGDSSLMDPSVENFSPSEIIDDPLSSGDRGEHRRKKTRLISMLDEVFRRYKQYYQQMQAIVASFESVPGLGNAAPYTSFALKTMSKHFKCLKIAITDQIRFMSKALGEQSYEKDGNPAFGAMERGFHCQRPVLNSGVVEHQHIWRPQRGLPERAVAVLRAWLFEHFLHPYPTDTDKQMLARQTGLTRSQVSNWFINARVRLWKPMVEEIHMLETRQAQKVSEAEGRNVDKPVDHPSGNTISSAKQPQNSSGQKIQDPPSKRTRNDFPPAVNGTDEAVNFSYHNPSNNHHQVGIGVNTMGVNSGVSLTLGLRQNNGIGFSEPFSMNIAHRFGLETSNQGFVMGGFEAQNRHFGKDIGGQLLRDFVG
ncbi:PREDICTED: BEL1-like homeodomain protein 9 [Nelumbo nucifera]|uniref:BEL1-like homeodomain protein 9 n=1 Tax=Nelumbo nucifera TaxID=4432 RepID=A0A1U8AJF8_NELNU|nr:PREDICTED: BEL1-like homeodomain protein 9 [Nelumbo nucifera]